MLQCTSGKLAPPSAPPKVCPPAVDIEWVASAASIWARDGTVIGMAASPVSTMSPMPPRTASVQVGEG